MTQVSFCTEWVSEAKAGNQQAIENLYYCSWNEVSIVIRAMVRTDGDTVQDLIQDTFVKAFRRLDQLDDPSKYRPWIKQIARNTALDYMKKNKPVLFSDLNDDVSMPVEFEDEDMSHLPDMMVEQQDMARILQEMLNSLSEMQRTVFSMHYVEEIPVKEIAVILGRKEGTIKAQLHNARDNLRKMILELEKKENIKLHSVAPLPLLLMLLRGMEDVPVPPTGVVVGSVLDADATAGTATAGTASGSAAKAAGGVAVKRIITGILAAITLVCGTVAYMAMNQPQDYPEKNLFTDVCCIVFDGENGKGTIQVSGLDGYGLVWDGEPVTGLTNGDTVTLVLAAPNGEDLNDYCEEKFGFTPAEAEMKYVVAGLVEPVSEGPAYDYDQLVEMYSAVISSEISIYQAGIDLSQSALMITPAGCSVDGDGFFAYRRDVWYSITEYDINGDGIKELMTFENSRNSDDPSSGSILDIFTFYDGKPVWLIAGEYRGRIQLCENGIIHMCGSGGAEAIGNWYYEIRNGELVLVDSVEMYWGSFFANGVESSEEVYLSTIAQYLPIAEPEYEWIATIEK